MRRVIAKTVRGAGYEWFAAENGREGMQLVAAYDPALVITDIFMPEMDGIEIIRILRCERPTLPILAISGGFGGQWHSLNYLGMARELGATMTLRKPFRVSVLLEAVAFLLGNPVLAPPDHSSAKADGKPDANESIRAPRKASQA